MKTIRAKGSLSKQQILSFAASCLVTIAIFSYLFTTITVGDVIHLIRNISTDWIVLFLLFSFSMSFFRTWRYLLVLRVSGFNPSKTALFFITLVRNFCSDLLPARLGTLIYIYLVQNRLSIPFGAAASSFSFALLFDMVALAFLIALTLFSGNVFVLPPVVIIGGAALLGFLSLALLHWLPAGLQIGSKLVESVGFIPEKYQRLFSEALADMRESLLIARKERIYWRIFSLSLGVRIFKYLSLYVLLLALVQPLGYTIAEFPFPLVFIGLCSAEMAASLPISGIAGFGAYEGVWAAVFQILGYPEKIAVLTSVSHHLITQVYGYSLGGIALLILMLPHFKAAPGDNDLDTHEDKRFWRKIVLSLFFISLVSSLFLSQQTIIKSAAGTNNLPAIQPAVQQSGDSLIDGLEAKIVYQRPDGIYTIRIHDRKPRRIVNFGSNPRWSPNGKQITFVHHNSIMLINVSENQPIELAQADKAKAVCFTPDGKAVLFTDGKLIRKVDIATREVSTILTDKKFKGLDISADGKHIAVTVRTKLGYKVLAFAMKDKSYRTVASGCSASLSPDGSVVTVNANSHKKVTLYSLQDLKTVGTITAPSGFKFDNQYWSNNAQWLVSTSEGKSNNIFIHHVASDSSFQITDSGDSDRGDMYVGSFAN